VLQRADLLGDPSCGFSFRYFQVICLLQVQPRRCVTAEKSREVKRGIRADAAAAAVEVR
jgi:hypothetical protein